MRPTLKSVGLTLLLLCSTTMVLCIPANMSRSSVLAQPATTQDRKVEGDRLLQQGKQQYQARDYPAAIQLWEKAMASYQTLKDRNGEAEVLTNLGLAYDSLSQYDKAIRYYTQALPRFQTANDRNGEANVLVNLGNAYDSLSQYDKAIGYYTQALSLFQAVKNLEGEAGALTSLGNAYDALSQYDKAIADHEQSLAIARKIKNRSIEGIALGNLGRTHQNLGNFTKAINYHLESLAIARELDDWRAEMKALGNLGITYDAQGDYTKAIDCHQESLELAQQLGDLHGESESYINLGVAYRSRGNYIKAIYYHEQSLLITREIKDRRGEGSALGNLGMDYYAQGNYTKAIDYHNQRLVIAHEIKDRQGEGNAMGNLGNAYRSQGNYAEAINAHERRLAITRAIKEKRGEGQSLGYLGLVYRSLGNYDKAIDDYNQSLTIARKINDRLGEAKSLGYLGNAYYDLGKYDEAIKYHTSSLTIARAISDRRGEGKSLGYLGNAYYAQGNYNEAIKSYKSGLEIARDIKDRRGEGNSLGYLGSAYYARGDYGQAIDYHKSSLEIARTIKSRDGERIALSNIGLTLQKQNQPNLAIAFYKQSVNVSEAIRQEIKKLPRDVQEVYTSSVSGTYRQLASLLLSQGRNREAQEILELLKVQEVRGYGKDQKTDAPIVQLTFHPSEAQALQAFEQAIAAKALSLQTLTAIGHPLIQNRDRITQESNNTPSTIGNPQAILNANPNALLIQNLVVGDKLWVLWTNASGNTTAIVTPNANIKQLTATVKDFREQQLGSPYSNLDNLKATSHQLYNLLIPPQLQAELAKHPRQQLIFSLDHVTRYIPVAALYDGKQYLAQRYILSNIITTDTDMRDHLALNGQTPNILALGTTNPFPPYFSALPNVAAELTAIVQDGSDSLRDGNTKRGIYPGKIRLNEAFTANSLRDNLDQFRVLHIATHGSFNPRSITASFLLLGNGSHLPITEIAATNLNATHLVVLSACQTGLSGSAQDGTEISGISGYFLYRGAKAVLASLWSVNDASTALLMQQFYKNLAQGKLTKAEALQKVQQAFIAGKLTAKEAKAIDRATLIPKLHPSASPTNFSHPFYWAPFILIGNGL